MVHSERSPPLLRVLGLPHVVLLVLLVPRLLDGLRSLTGVGRWTRAVIQSINPLLWRGWTRLQGGSNHTLMFETVIVSIELVVRDSYTYHIIRELFLLLNLFFDGLFGLSLDPIHGVGFVMSLDHVVHEARSTDASSQGSFLSCSTTSHALVIDRHTDFSKPAILQFKLFLPHCVVLLQRLRLHGFFPYRAKLVSFEIVVGWATLQVELMNFLRIFLASGDARLMSLKQLPLPLGGLLSHRLHNVIPFLREAHVAFARQVNTNGTLFGSAPLGIALSSFFWGDGNSISYWIVEFGINIKALIGLLSVGRDHWRAYISLHRLLENTWPGDAREWWCG